jgi:acyl-CoA thioester hydrolase/carnitine 3-dehydrogenase
MMTGNLQPSTLCLWRGSVQPDWLDYNGHMTEHRYLQVFGESSDALYERIGVDMARADEGAYYTLSTFITHLAECKLGTALESETEILGYDARFLHLFHRVFDAAGQPLAEGEHLAIHVRHGASGPAPSVMQEAIGRLFALQVGRPVPPTAGKVLRRALQHSRLT